MHSFTTIPHWQMTFVFEFFLPLFGTMSVNLNRCQLISANIGWSWSRLIDRSKNMSVSVNIGRSQSILVDLSQYQSMSVIFSGCQSISVDLSRSRSISFNPGWPQSILVDLSQCFFELNKNWSISVKTVDLSKSQPGQSITILKSILVKIKFG